MAKAQSPKSSSEKAGALASSVVGDLFNTTTKIHETHTSELVIALCGPIGSPLHDVSAALKTCLEEDFKYERCEVIRLSSIIRTFSKKKIETDNRFNEIRSLISGGDDLREIHGSGVLAELAIHQISNDREEEIKKQEEDYAKPRRVCHIIDSIKNQEELDVLRAVYREMLYCVGVFSPLTIREGLLSKKGLSSPEIYQLIDQDSGEEFDHGQTVRDTFPQSDYFLRLDLPTTTDLEEKTKRFLDLILGTRVITPNLSETAMYMAASAATNSACLSRQVGASLTDKDGIILSVGWNDVPKTGGGLYTSDIPVKNDNRCWNNPAYCSNDNEKDTIALTIASALVKKGLVSSSDKDAARRALRSDEKLKGLIEFSRAVHAEMHAIITAGKNNGDRIAGGKLFCTTYPCHSCARHIIAAGIREVYYIEPYPKSLAIRLHGDAITENESANEKVRILPYEGVSPSRYYSLFQMKPDSRKIKTTGKVKEFKRTSAEPKISKTLEALTTLESLVVRGLRDKKLIDSEG